MALQRLPPFKKENPKFWFIQVESAMQLAKITSNDVETPPAIEKYQTIKRHLLEMFTQSEESKVRHLLRTCRMGDEKPSLFLQRLRNLAGNNVPDSMLKTIFLQIPSSLRDILMASDNNDLARLALLADKISEFKSSQISAVNRGNASEFTGKVMMVREDSMAATCREMKQMAATRQEFEQRITELTRQLTALQMERPQESFWRRRSRSRGMDVLQFDDDLQNGIQDCAVIVEILQHKLIDVYLHALGDHRQLRETTLWLRKTICTSCSFDGAE